MTAPLFGIDDPLDTDHWYTPPWIFDGLGLTFDLDVAAPAEPQPWLPARAVYTIADDGLAQDWHGLVWCNPPYSNPQPWCQRWAQHPWGCLLIRADLSSSGPLFAFAAASSVYVAAKRIQFVDGRGGPTGAAPFSSVLFGRGATADAGLFRLAAKYGGMARHLSERRP